MAIPIDVGRLIVERTIESERIEYKKGWDPESILHTMCAFANDIDNLGGGYIIVGVEEVDGMPGGTIVGVDPAAVDGYNKEFLNLCNKVEPRYLAETDTVVIDGKTLFAIWVSGGNDRPYKCPTGLSSRNESKAYYIRKMSSTVRANPSEERELFNISEVVPFDDRPNRSATLSSLRVALIEEYLSMVHSTLAGKVFSMPIEEVARKLHLVSGPSEDLRPINVALMFFNDHPEDYFRNAHIEVVLKPDPTGINMVERTFSGPLNRQIVDVVSYIRNNVLEEMVVKRSDRAEADRISNYPIGAIEEAVSNAVYHKSYQIPEPVTIVVTSDRLEITSIPGPDRGITDEDLRNLRMVGKRYRNRRIGDYLKEFGLAEARNTGVPLMVESMVSNGSDLPVFRTDPERSYFTVVLHKHSAFIQRAVMKGDRVTVRRTRQEIIDEVIALLSTNGEMSMRDLSDSMGYKSPPTSLKAVVSMLISDGTLEYTRKERASPYQRIRMVRRGRPRLRPVLDGSSSHIAPMSFGNMPMSASSMTIMLLAPSYGGTVSRPDSILADDGVTLTIRLLS